MDRRGLFLAGCGFISPPSFDRLQETVNGVTTTFVMDLNSSLTQALSDGTHDYIYGNGRIAQVNTSTLNTEYFLGDALGSVRQLTDSTSAVTFAQGYAPYGSVTTTSGSGASSYGFTNEYQSQGKIYLRARHYAPSLGRFLTRDTWGGDANSPMSYNRWSYVEGNPINRTDPSGMVPCSSLPPEDQDNCVSRVSSYPLSNVKARIRILYGIQLSSESQDGVLTNEENWTPGALIQLEGTLQLLANKFSKSVDRELLYNYTGYLGEIPGPELFRIIYSGLEIRRGDPTLTYIPNTQLFGWASKNLNLYRAYGPSENWKPGSLRGRKIILHEFAHIFNWRFQGGDVAVDDFIAAINDPCTGLKPLITFIKKGEVDETGDFGILTRSGLGVNFRSSTDEAEIWADLFASWALDSFYSLPKGNDGQVFKDYIYPDMNNKSTYIAIIWAQQHGYNAKNAR